MKFNQATMAKATQIVLLTLLAINLAWAVFVGFFVPFPGVTESYWLRFANLHCMAVPWFWGCITMHAAVPRKSGVGVDAVFPVIITTGLFLVADCLLWWLGYHFETPVAGLLFGGMAFGWLFWGQAYEQ